MGSGSAEPGEPDARSGALPFPVPASGPRTLSRDNDENYAANVQIWQRHATRLSRESVGGQGPDFDAAHRGTSLTREVHLSTASTSSPVASASVRQACRG
jgi:hypothetical protein